jgi:hypothetical protein
VTWIVHERLCKPWPVGLRKCPKMEEQIIIDPAEVHEGQAETLLDILDDTPLLPGERLADFEAIKDAVIREVDPKTIIDWVLVGELATSLFEERRYRRYRDTFIRSMITYPLRSKLEDAIGFYKNAEKDANALKMTINQFAGYLATNYLAGFSDIDQAIGNILDSAGQSLDDVLSFTVSKNFEQIQKFELLINNAVKARNRVISEIERRKDRRQALIEKMNAIAGEIKQ